MTMKLLAAAAFSLALGTAAIAQTTTQPGAGATAGATSGMTLPSGWEGAIGDAFFSDAQAGTLRSQEEISTNWGTLSAEQQAQVRTHCHTVDTAAAGSGAAGTTTGGAAGTTSNETTASTSQGASMHMAAIEQICGWVDSM